MGFKRAEDFSEGIHEVWRKGWTPGVSTGWPNLDRFYTARECEFTVVTGMPSHGKSEFMASMLVNLAKAHNWKIAIVSPEHQPTHRFVCRLIEKYAQELFTDLPNRPKISPATLAEAMNWIDEHFCFYESESDKPPITEFIFSELDNIQTRFGKYNGLLLDPYNEFDHSRTELDARLSETEYIATFLSSLRRSARKRKIHLWLVAHPRKPEKRADGTYAPVKLFDIAGSANFRNMADNGLSIYRNELEGGETFTTVFIEKVKFREIGEMGETYFSFNKLTGEFTEYIPKSEQEER